MKPRHFLLAGILAWVCLIDAQVANPQVGPARTGPATVPFVGCASDGQVGPLGAPKGQSKTVRISTNSAQMLAYYKAEDGLGVLAPRGWRCFSIYGSSGSNLFVSPDPIDPKSLFSENWKGFSGQAIQVSESIGDTSGRFRVAETIARLFPAYKAFVQHVIAEDLRPASDFPKGPYPNDKLKYRSKRVVEFETPSNTKGIGTESMLQRTSSPIRGVAILFGEEPSLVQLSAKLPANDEGLIGTIVEQVEDEAAHSKDQ